MNNPIVANTILNQLGGRTFCMMTGAKNFSYDSNSLYFKIGRNCKSINYVIIKLEADDTYSMKFCYASKNGVKVRKEIPNGVYCDMLQEVFRENTGMETRMPRIVGFNC